MSLRLNVVAVAILAIGPGSLCGAQVADTIVVQAYRTVAKRSTGEVVYSGGVSVLFGPTKLTADKLTVRGDPAALGLPLGAVPAETIGIAEGHVRIDDPDGTVTADRFEYDWTKRVGKALGVVVRSDRVIVRAETLDVTEKRWVLTNVSATTCGSEKPIYLLNTPRLEITPGQAAIARGLRLALFGRTVLTVPYARMSLDQRVSGFTFPTISVQENGKVGVTSENSFLIGDRSALDVNFGSFPGESLRYDLQIITSRIPPTASQGLIVPRSELSERFAYGYFDNVAVTAASAERTYLELPRDSLGVGTFWNHTASSRWGGDTFSKPWEVTYEFGGPLGELGSLTQLRAQRIGIVHGHAENRLQGQTSLLLPAWSLAHGLESHIRLDGAAFAGESGDFGWGIGQFGMVYSPASDVRLGGALLMGGEFGKPTFDADRLYTKVGANLRADWGRGPTKFSILAKYDFGQKRWFDYEYSVSQITGCFEPYVIWRRFPDRFSFGIGLRADKLIEKLKKRDFRGEASR